METEEFVKIGRNNKILGRESELDQDAQTIIDNYNKLQERMIKEKQEKQIDLDGRQNHPVS